MMTTMTMLMLCWHSWRQQRRCWWWWTYLPISQSWQPLVKMSARELEPKRRRDYPICWFASIMLIFQFADWSSIIIHISLKLKRIIPFADLPQSCWSFTLLFGQLSYMANTFYRILKILSHLLIRLNYADLSICWLVKYCWCLKTPKLILSLTLWQQNIQ